MTETELQETWDIYRSTGDVAARRRLLQHYYPLVEGIGNRLSSKFPPNVDCGDLVADGVFGLSEALDRFDPSYGYKFEVYATQRIKGEMLDKMRKADWVPRSLRTKIRLIEKILSEYQDKNEKISDQEIAKKLGVPAEEVQEVVSLVHGHTIVSFEDPIRGQAEDSETLVVADVVIHKDHHTEYDYEMKELMEHLSDAIDSLPSREKVVTVLYYMNELTLGKIGEVMEITEARACQLHTRAMLRLKERCAGIR